MGSWRKPDFLRTSAARVRASCTFRCVGCPIHPVYGDIGELSSAALSFWAVRDGKDKMDNSSQERRVSVGTCRIRSGAKLRCADRGFFGDLGVE